MLRKYNTVNFIVTYKKTSIQVFRLLGEYIRVSVQRMSLSLIILLRLAEMVPVTLPRYILQICHPHASWLPIVLCDQLLEPLHDAFFNFRSVDFHNQFHWNFQPPFTAQLSGDLPWFLFTISTPTIPPLYVYHLVLGRSSETNGNIRTCSREGDPYLKTDWQRHRVE